MTEQDEELIRKITELKYSIFTKKKELDERFDKVEKLLEKHGRAI